MVRNDKILEIKDLHISYQVYGGELKVVDGISLSVSRGERVGLVGETGCAKTTTMKAILKILPRNAIIKKGHIEFNGTNVLNMNDFDIQQFRRKGAAMIFQDPTAALNPVFTVGDQMKAALRYSYSSGMQKLSEEEISIKLIQALKDVSLPDPHRILNCFPFQLSGGMKQRICIAMAISAGKKILLADEPGTSLDVTIQDQVLRLISELVDKKNLSVVIVTHSLGVVKENTDYTYVMYAGTIVEGGPTEVVFSKPLHPYTIMLMKCVPKLTGEGIAQGIPGRLIDYLNPPRGCRFSPRCPYVEEICENEKPDLFDIGGQHSVACHLVER